MLFVSREKINTEVAKLPVKEIDYKEVAEIIKDCVFSNEGNVHTYATLSALTFGVPTRDFEIYSLVSKNNRIEIPTKNVQSGRIGVAHILYFDKNTYYTETAKMVKMCLKYNKSPMDCPPIQVSRIVKCDAAQQARLQDFCRRYHKLVSIEAMKNGGVPYEALLDEARNL